MESAIESLIPVIAIIFLFGIPGIIVFWYINARHRERMRLIEKGLTAAEIKEYFSNIYVKGKNQYSALKWGMLLVFIGIGLFLSIVIEETTEIGDSLTPAFLLLFAGAGFLIYYLIVRKKTPPVLPEGEVKNK